MSNIKNFLTSNQINSIQRPRSICLAMLRQYILPNLPKTDLALMFAVFLRTGQGEKYARPRRESNLRPLHY